MGLDIKKRKDGFYNVKNLVNDHTVRKISIDDVRRIFMELVIDRAAWEIENLLSRIELTAVRKTMDQDEWSKKYYAERSQTNERAEKLAKIYIGKNKK